MLKKIFENRQWESPMNHIIRWMPGTEGQPSDAGMHVPMHTRGALLILFTKKPDQNLQNWTTNKLLFWQWKICSVEEPSVLASNGT